MSDFDLVFPESDGLCCCMKDSKYGYINNKNEIVIPFIYDYAFPFKDMRALVRRNGLWGILDNKGTVKAEFVFDMIYPFSDNRACFSINDKFGFLDYNGKRVIEALYDEAYPFSFSLAKVRKRDKWGYIDMWGNVVIPLKYADGHNCINGLLVVNSGGFYDDRWGVTIGGKWFVLNDKGKQISKSYTLITNYVDGVAKVNIGGRYENNDCFMGGLWGVLNMDGEECVPLIYEEISNIMDGCFRVKKKGKYGVINTHGEMIIPIKYDFIAPLSYGETFAVCDGQRIHLK